MTISQSYNSYSYSYNFIDSQDNANIIAIAKPAVEQSEQPKQTEKSVS